MDKNLKNGNILINSRKIISFLCGKVCGKLLFKILIIYFIYVIVKPNGSANLKEKPLDKFANKMWKNIKFLFRGKINRIKERK